MRTEEIRKQIENAIADERQRHGYRAWLLRTARAAGGAMSDRDIEELLDALTRYMEEVPRLLEAGWRDVAAGEASRAFAELLDTCERSWFVALSTFPDHRAVASCLDAAYTARRVLAAIDESFGRRLGPDFATLDRMVRALIGEPAASRLDRVADDVAPRLQFEQEPPAGEATDLGVAPPGRLEEAVRPPRTGEHERSAPRGDVDAFDDTLGIDETVANRPSQAPPPKPPPSPMPRPQAPPPMAPPSPAPPSPRRSGRQPDATRKPRPVSTGFASVGEPGRALPDDKPIVPNERYYFWLEVNEVPGSIEQAPQPLPADKLPPKARLTVVLFSPDGGFRPEPGEAAGELELQPDGSAKVIAAAGKRRAGISEELAARRLLFPVRAPAERGEYRLRCSIYCRGVLVQSRLIEVQVGGARRVSRVDYTLATRLVPAKLDALPEHRLAIQMNHQPGGSHDFYIYGGDGREAFHDTVNLTAKDLEGALEFARAALCKASWGDEDEWAATKRYRYDGTETIDTLREDLATLAIAGWRIYDLLIDQLAGGRRNVPRLATLVREPGLLQITPDVSLGMSLPAALVYDHRINPQAKPAAEYALCPEFERAFRDRTPLADTACFLGRCPSEGQLTTVCPSGFWGFRHALGLPISTIEDSDEGEARLDARLEYDDAPLLVVGVSRARDLPHSAGHAKDLQALRPEWRDAWRVRDRLDALLDVMRSSQPHLVYLYCHASLRPVGRSEMPMLFLGEDPQAARPNEWLERSMLRAEVEWTKPRPLVFLNGCHSAALDEHTTLDLVTGFVQVANACGVVGTEVTVFEPLACAFAEKFMKRFLDGAMVGQAIRDTRLDLLQDGNPLGLVYTPFVLGATQLVPAERVVDAALPVAGGQAAVPTG